VPFWISTLIELTFRHRQIREKVDSTIPIGSDRLTSRYVIFEIARGYLLALVILHNKAMAVQSMLELHEYLHSGQQQFKRYRRETMLGAFDDFLAYLQTLGQSLTENQCLSMFRGWLAQHLRRGWQRLSRNIEVTNSIGCREDIPPPKRNVRGLYEQPLPVAGMWLRRGLRIGFLSFHAPRRL